ncbi:MAG: hypothetical protein V9G12_10450 [Microthrixaceae bacterium]
MGCDHGEADDPVGAGDDGRVVRDDQHRSAVVGDRAESVDDEGDPLGVGARSVRPRPGRRHAASSP